MFKKRFFSGIFKNFPFMLVLIVGCVGTSKGQGADSLSLEYAIDQALLNDDWLVASEYREQALREEAVFAGELPDPRMMVSLQNLPVNTFDFNQEPMTQFRVGVSQSFPRGESRELSQQHKRLQSEVNPYLREDRRASVALQVALLWLDAYLSKESMNLINADRELFEQMVDITDSRYRNTAGPARQQDLVRAQLALTRLEDRLAALHQREQENRQALARWIPFELLHLEFPRELPDFNQPDEEFSSLVQASSRFMDHPRIKAMDKKIEASQTNVELTRQNFKPGFSLGASYGYREDGPFGIQRDDFISLEVSFDLPLFTERRQKPQVEAASNTAAAIQTERILLLKNLFADYQRALAQLRILEERRDLFNNTLLVQMRDLTEATLAAYNTDEGDFAEVMRAYINELDARIELVGINVERAKTLAKLHYLFTSSKN
jgi:outer membrane protein TolC